MNKNQLLQYAEQANINNVDWIEDIKPHLTDYQRGYFDAKNEELTNSLESSDEDYREEIFSLLETIL